MGRASRASDMGSCVLLAVLCGLLSSSLALFPEEAGNFDWRIQLVGEVEFSANIPELRRVFVGTQDGIIASLNNKNGELGVASISSRGSRVRMWDGATGVLLWESSVSPTLAKKALALQIVSPWAVCSSDGLLVRHATNARLLSAGDGAVKWESSFANATVLGLAHAASADTAFILSVNNAETDAVNVQLTKLDLVQASAKSAGAVTVSSQNVLETCSTTSTALVCVQDSHVHVAVLGSDLALDPSTVHAIEVESIAGQFVLVPNANGATVYSVGEDLHLVQTLEGVITLGESTSDGRGIVSQLHHNTLTIFATSASNTPHLETVRVAAISLTSAPAAIFSATPLGDKSAFLVLGHDGALHYLPKSKDEFLWTRPEHLRHLVASAFVDLLAPQTDADVHSSNFIFQGIARVSAQISMFLEYLSHKGSTGPAIERDAFNLHKFIVVLTRSGVLAALSTVDGSIVWQRTISLSPIASATLQAVQADAHTSSYAAVYTLPGDETFVEVFNPFNGHSSLHDVAGNIRATGVIPGPAGAHSGVVIVIDKDLKVHHFPNFPDFIALAREYVTEHLTVVHALDRETGHIEGFRITASETGLQAESVWQVTLPRTHERIVAVAARPLGDKFHSVGDILSDRTVMYKYLNPHMLGIATLAGEGHRDGATLAIYALDTIKGTFVERLEHENVQGPVNLVHSDNWFAYSYRDRKNRRWMLSVLELFDGAGKPPATGLSSLRLSRPIVVSQSFIMPQAVLKMGVTVTDAGIAYRAIIVSLPSGRLAAIQERFFDPRRPIGTAPRTEEQVPYHPLMPLDVSFLLNYNLTVFGVEGITCSPTALESTSLVFATGLDLFFTRAMPSKRFDLLNEDFNRPMLLLSLAAMAVATVLAARKNASSNLKAAWA